MNIKKLAGKVCLGAALAISIGSGVCRAVIFESFEGETNGAFDGTADHVWLGDTASYDIDSATWPVSPAPDFAGSHSLRSGNLNVALDLSVVTSLTGSYDPIQTTFWSVFVSGGAQSFTDTPRDFSLILMSDSSSAAALEAGTMNGYRLRFGDDPGAGGTTDSLLFEEANGSGWVTLANNSLGGNRVINEGWNILVSRNSLGLFNYGFSNGALGTPVTLAFSTTDSTVTAASFTGMNYRSPLTGDNAFGFDNFMVTTIPEPRPCALLSLGGFLLWRRRR